MTVVRFAMDEMPGIVKRRCSFQNRSQFEIHVMVGPQLVKELQGKATNLLSVFQVATHPAGK